MWQQQDAPPYGYQQDRGADNTQPAPLQFGNASTRFAGAAARLEAGGPFRDPQHSSVQGWHNQKDVEQQHLSQQYPWHHQTPAYQQQWSYQGEQHLQSSLAQGPASGYQQQHALGNMPSYHTQQSQQLPYSQLQQHQQQGWPAPVQQAQPGVDIQPEAQDESDLSLRAVRDLPPAFQPLYSKFRYFNSVQSECFSAAYESDVNMLVSAPTGSGKTGVMELALLRLLERQLDGEGRVLQGRRGAVKAVYIGPMRALVQEKLADWAARFGSGLGCNCLELTGDSEPEPGELDAADIICTTPEKFDGVTRRMNEKGGATFFAEVALVMIDEVHLLGESERGSSLEAGVVSRIKMVSQFPDMKEMPIARVRFVAVSATIPNVRDIGQWLGVPAAGLKEFGEEVRPCKLQTIVRNEFLFEKRLNEYLPNIIREFCNNKPTLVFCSSRKDTFETAKYLAGSGGNNSPYIRDMGNLERLKMAAQHMQNRTLATLITAGVGVHSAGIESEDRLRVERLFLEQELLVLCTTSTLALGVNLPAHLVVIKGTRRYAGDSGGGAGHSSSVALGTRPVAPAGGGDAAVSSYKEYDRSVCLQMVGRAGRPGFDTEGTAVIMTQRQTVGRYTNLVAGAEEVESTLGSSFAEHLNAEISLQTISDVPQAVLWLRTTFLYIRMRSRPAAYGVQAAAAGRALTEAQLDTLLRDRLVLENVKTLAQHGLALTDEDGISLKPAEPGRLMAHHCISLKTMVSICQTPASAGMMQLLRMLAQAAEFENLRLRRAEKKVLNSINARTGDGALKHFLPDASDPSKRKKLVATDGEKILLLLGDALSDAPATDAMEYSLKQESDHVVRISQRIATCMAKYYAHKGQLAATANALQLVKALKYRMWEDTTQQVRQLPNIGRLMAQRLAADGLGTLAALDAADARRIEMITQRNYPFGSQIKAELRARMPPRISLQLQQVAKLSGGRIQVEVTLTRLSGPRTPGGAAAGLHSAGTAAKLLVGSRHDDKLLLMRGMIMETFPSPFTLHVTVSPPTDRSSDFHIIGSVILEQIVGLDQITSLRAPAFGQTQVTDYLRPAAKQVALVGASGSTAGLEAAEGGGSDGTVQEEAGTVEHARAALQKPKAKQSQGQAQRKATAVSAGQQRPAVPSAQLDVSPYRFGDPDGAEAYPPGQEALGGGSSGARPQPWQDLESRGGRSGLGAYAEPEQMVSKMAARFQAAASRLLKAKAPAPTGGQAAREEDRGMLGQQDEMEHTADRAMGVGSSVALGAEAVAPQVQSQQRDRQQKQQQKQQQQQGALGGDDRDDDGDNNDDMAEEEEADMSEALPSFDLLGLAAMPGIGSRATRIAEAAEGPAASYCPAPRVPANVHTAARGPSGGGGGCTGGNAAAGTRLSPASAPGPSDALDLPPPAPGSASAVAAASVFADGTEAAGGGDAAPRSTPRVSSISVFKSKLLASTGKRVAGPSALEMLQALHKKQRLTAGESSGPAWSATATALAFDGPEATTGAGASAARQHGVQHTRAVPPLPLAGPGFAHSRLQSATLGPASLAPSAPSPASATTGLGGLGSLPQVAKLTPQGLPTKAVAAKLTPSSARSTGTSLSHMASGVGMAGLDLLSPPARQGADLGLGAAATTRNGSGASDYSRLPAGGTPGLAAPHAAMRPGQPSAVSPAAGYDPACGGGAWGKRGPGASDWCDREGRGSLAGVRAGAGAPVQPRKAPMDWSRYLDDDQAVPVKGARHAQQQQLLPHFGLDRQQSLLQEEMQEQQLQRHPQATLRGHQQRPQLPGRHDCLEQVHPARPTGLVAAGTASDSSRCSALPSGRPGSHEIVSPGRRPGTGIAGTSPQPRCFSPRSARHEALKDILRSQGLAGQPRSLGDDIDAQCTAAAAQLMQSDTGPAGVASRGGAGSPGAASLQQPAGYAAARGSASRHIAFGAGADAGAEAQSSGLASIPPASGLTGSKAGSTPEAAAGCHSLPAPSTVAPPAPSAPRIQRRHRFVAPVLADSAPDPFNLMCSQASQADRSTAVTTVPGMLRGAAGARQGLNPQAKTHLEGSVRQPRSPAGRPAAAGTGPGPGPVGANEEDDTVLSFL